MMIIFVQYEFFMPDFLKAIILFFSHNNIEYMLSGSVALSVYTLPRATRDFDFVVHLKSKDTKPLIEYFKEGYYCDANAVKEAVQNHSMFNIIDHSSGFKADFVILKNEPFRQTEFGRKRAIDFYGMPVYIVSPEDLLLSKLIWIQDFQSNIQMEDIKNLAALRNLDLSYIHSWIHSLKLNTFNLF
jgi:hypothetical protein